MSNEQPQPEGEPSPSSRSTREMIRESAQRNPVWLVALGGTFGLGTVTGLIEILKAARDVSGATGIVWQVMMMVLTALWALAAYAGFQARENRAKAEAAQAKAERDAEMERQRVAAQQRAAERAEERDERNLQALHEVVGAMQGAIVELKADQAATNKLVGSLAKTVQHWISGETTRPGVPRPLAGNL